MTTDISISWRPPTILGLRGEDVARRRASSGSETTTDAQAKRKQQIKSRHARLRCLLSMLPHARSYTHGGARPARRMQTRYTLRATLTSRTKRVLLLERQLQRAVYQRTKHLLCLPRTPALSLERRMHSDCDGIAGDVPVWHPVWHTLCYCI